MVQLGTLRKTCTCTLYEHACLETRSDNWKFNGRGMNFANCVGFQMRWNLREKTALGLAIFAFFIKFCNKRKRLRDWLSTHSCMPLQQLPTVTKDADAHARLGYVRSQSLASTTTSPGETRGGRGKLLPTAALKNVGKTKSTPLAKIPADEHIFSPPDDAHRCSSDAEWTPKADRANFRSSSTRPHSYRSPDKCHECVKKGQLHWGEPLRLAISWSSW